MGGFVVARLEALVPTKLKGVRREVHRSNTVSPILVSKCIAGSVSLLLELALYC
ncbi:MAG: hypothetical protein QXS54_00830 [Candidatus Methanomethylicaceae archaeon]